MELRKAIQRVAKVCPRKKSQEIYRAIRILQLGDSWFLQATDGLVGSLVKLDEKNLPSVLIPVDPMVAATKDKGSLVITNAGYGNVFVDTGRGRYFIQGRSFDGFPPVPPMPNKFNPLDDWIELQKVFHAASVVDSELSVINFRSDCVEATDKNRFARVNISGSWRGLIPVSLFKSWPSEGRVFWGFTEMNAFFWVNDELRYSPLLANPSYPKTDGLVPKEHVGNSVVVSTDMFLEAVNRGMKLSKLGLVTVSINGELVIRAWQEEDSSSGFSAKLPMSGYVGGKVLLLLKGKYVVDALKNVITPNVCLCYGLDADPLRIESGVFTACIWSMVYV